MNATANVRRTDRKHTDILDAATLVFQEEGYEVASMDRIAERAGASKRTVYNHFGSKEALFDAVVERMVAETSAQKRLDFDPARSLESQLEDFARVKSGLTSETNSVALLRVVLGVFIRDPARAQEVMERASAGEDALARWLEAAHRAGQLEVDAPERAAELFWAMVSGMLFWPQLLGGPMPEDERARKTDEVIATFLCRYRRNPVGPSRM